MDSEVGLTAFARATGVVMEGAPEDGPIAVAFHSNRLTEDFFGGGKNIFHEIFCNLLLNVVKGYELDESNGDQDEKHC